MLPESATPSYSQVEEAGRLVPKDSGERQAPGGTWQCRAGWVFVWAVSVFAAFVVGFCASPRVPFPLKTSAAGSPDAADETILLDSLPTLYGIYDGTFKSARYIDLTHAFSPKIPVWAGFGPASVKSSVVGATMTGFAEKGEDWTYLKHGFVATAYGLSTDQYGTQLDPPAHWNEYGATISDLPATIALRPLVVINIAGKVAENPGYHACVEDVLAWEAAHNRIPEGSVVFFRSDWSKRWAEYEEMDELPSTFPGVKLETLKFLHHERKILFHGHEPLDTDMTASLEGEAWLLHNNFAQAEGVTNLDQVPEFGCLLSIGFAKPLGGSGGYARYVAICPQGSTSGGTTIEESPGAPLPQQKYPLRRNSDGVLVPDADAEATDYCSVASALGCAANRTPVWEV